MSKENQSKGNMGHVKQQVEDVRKAMALNIEELLQRAENLESLDKRVEALKSNADAFTVGSKALSRKMWWRNTRMMMILVAVVVVVFLLVAVGIGENLMRWVPAANSNSTFT